MTLITITLRYHDPSGRGRATITLKSDEQTSSDEVIRLARAKVRELNAEGYDVDVRTQIDTSADAICPLCCTDDDGCYCRYDAEPIHRD